MLTNILINLKGINAYNFTSHVILSPISFHGYSYLTEMCYLFVSFTSKLRMKRNFFSRMTKEDHVQCFSFCKGYHTDICEKISIKMFLMKNNKEREYLIPFMFQYSSSDFWCTGRLLSLLRKLIIHTITMISIYFMVLLVELRSRVSG